MRKATSDATLRCEGAVGCRSVSCSRRADAECLPVSHTFLAPRPTLVAEPASGCGRDDYLLRRWSGMTTRAPLHVRPGGVALTPPLRGCSAAATGPESDIAQIAAGAITAADRQGGHAKRARGSRPTRALQDSLGRCPPVFRTGPVPSPRGNPGCSSRRAEGRLFRSRPRLLQPAPSRSPRPSSRRRRHRSARR